MSDYSPLISALAFFLTIFGAVWSLAWWLSGQFTAIRSLIYSTAEKTTLGIMSKLEYHEKHDDQRFIALGDQIQNVRDVMWDMRVRQAAKDGTPPLKPYKSETRNNN